MPPAAVPNANLFTHLRAAFPSALDGVAVEVDPQGLAYSWRDLDRASAMLANLLASLGLPTGARVVVQVEKSVEALMLYLATLRAGCVFVPLNTAYRSAEIDYFLGDAEAAVLVCSPSHLHWVTPLAERAGTRHLFTLGTEREGTLLEAAALCSDQHRPASVHEDDLAAILYTSGTTGRSKGAMLTHRNLLSNAQVLKDYWDWQSGDVLLHVLPIFHVHGLFVAIHGALLNGSPMIWCNRFDPARTVARLPEASVFMGVPTLYVRLLNEPGLTPAACARMRLFISGSAPLLIETFHQWQTRTGHTILERYGMSETTMLTSNPCRSQDGARRGGTVGWPLPGVQLRVRDEQGRDCAPGDIGNIEVRGPNVFAGYWRMPDKTKEEFTTDGYFKTGDIGQRDTQGYLRIVGRSKDLIISGGYNVYPAEIEGFINELPGVMESAVIGVPHPDFGEVGVALVIPQPGATLDGEALLAQLKTQLANFKIPKRCFILPELPRNAMGKVQKALLRERYAKLFA